MNRAIGKALRLDPLQTLIVCRNVQFTAKTHILKTAIRYTRLGASARDRYGKIIEAISNASHIRNMMAHDVFLPSQDTDGVVFHAVKARGEVKIPDEDWSIEKFTEWHMQLTEWCGQIQQLRKEIAPDVKTLSELLTSLASGPQAAPVPTGGLFGLGPNVLPDPQTPGILGSIHPEPNPETDPQTDIEPRER